MPDEMTNSAPDAGTGDIESILGATSQSDPSAQTHELASQQGAEQAFKFGGRTYKTQAEAEKAHNALYGKYSEQQGIFNQLKAALKDPRKLQQLSSDPQWAPILAKLGVQQAEEEFENEEAAARERGEDYSDLPPAMQQFVHQQRVQAESLKLDREEWAFERKLGRSVTSDEHNAVMKIIARAQELSYEEAWKLSFHDKLLKDAQARQKTAIPPKGNRPSPVSGFIPAVKMDLKKPPTEMSKAEFREHLRGSPEFKQLMSRE